LKIRLQPGDPAADHDRRIEYDLPADVSPAPQGVQYAATAYTPEWRAHGIQIGMAEVGEPTQNGYAERLTLAPTAWAQGINRIGYNGIGLEPPVKIRQSPGRSSGIV